MVSLLIFVVQPYDETMQQTMFCSYFYSKIDLNKRNEEDEDILFRLCNTTFKSNEQALNLLKKYNFNFVGYYKGKIPTIYKGKYNSTFWCARYAS